ncbi:hypothetical protein Ait01nite_056960 [Actinoplanes italicus]|nr:hypothetical protein Ait01nite_056960 [Actinoplanes italicus]
MPTRAAPPELGGVTTLKTVETAALMLTSEFVALGRMVSRFGPVTEPRGFLPAEQRHLAHA